MSDTYLQLLHDRETLLQCKYAFDLLTHNYFNPLPESTLPPEQFQRYYLIFLTSWVEGTVELLQTTARHLHFFRLQGELQLFLAEHRQKVDNFLTAVQQWQYPGHLDDEQFILLARKRLESLVALCQRELEIRVGVIPIPVRQPRLPSTTDTDTEESPGTPPKLVPALQRYARIITDGYRQMFPSV